MKQIKKILFTVLSLLMINSLLAQVTSFRLNGRDFILEENNWWVIDNSSGNKYLVNMNSLTVKLKEGLSTLILNSLNTTYGINIENENTLGYIDLTLPANLDIFEITEIYNQTGLFSYININSYGKIFSNDPYYPHQHYLYNSSVPYIFANDYFWQNAENGSPEVIVAVIDVGVQWDHIDLDDNMWYQLGYNYLEGDPNDPTPLAIDYHGTSIAGIIAAETNNEEFCAGIAGGWGLSDEGAKITALRIGHTHYIPNQGTITHIHSEYLDDAIIWAADHGAKVINMSLGALNTQESVNAINYAYWEKNCLLVAAVGQNEDRPNDPIGFPANHSRVLAVGGIDLLFEHYGFWNGPLEVVAPSHNIYSLTNSGSGNVGQGTSYSSAEVSGVAALCFSNNPNLLQIDVRRVINQYADKSFGTYNQQYFGNGLVKLNHIWEYLEDPINVSPQQPIDLQITAPIGSNPILSWSKVGSKLNYNIYRAADYEGRYNFQLVGTVNYIPGQNNYTWTDINVIVTHPRTATAQYFYRITSVYPMSDFASITSNEVTTFSNSVEKSFTLEEGNALKYWLANNYPNPFNPITEIMYSIKDDSWVKLEIYNSIGQKIKTLVDSYLKKGIYEVKFNAKELPSGVYFYSLTTDKFSDVNKMILMK